MPYTFSHPAAVMPLRKYLPFSALVVGSMAPDYLSFVPWIRHRHYGHSTEGIFTFCIPASFLVLWFFHAVLKRPLLRLAPYSHQRKLARFTGEFHFGGAKRLLLITLAIWVGIELHIWWDAFTHVFGYFPRRFPILLTPMTDSGRFLLTDLLQHGTSVLGGLVLLDLYRRWLMKAPESDVPTMYQISDLVRIAAIGCMVALAVGIGILLPTPYSFVAKTHLEIVSHFALDITRVFLIEVFILALAWLPQVRPKAGAQDLR